MSVNLPYPGTANNSIYELLFCDNLDTYRSTIQTPRTYPWDVLLSDSPSGDDLRRIIMDTDIESRIRLLACHVCQKAGHALSEKFLLGVIVELGLEDGLDVLASYRDGTARYINYSGKLLVWEAGDLQSALITKSIFDASEKIVERIGPWNQARRPFPAQGQVRISFLVTDGLYFGEGPIHVLFSDPFAAPALNAMTSLLQYITSHSD